MKEGLREEEERGKRDSPKTIEATRILPQLGVMVDALGVESDEGALFQQSAVREAEIRRDFAAHAD